MSANLFSPPLPLLNKFLRLLQVPEAGGEFSHLIISRSEQIN
jgi:hypothetical protein